MTTPEYLHYDSVLPMSIWFNERLEPTSIKLYAITRGLANKYGYCFATNQYLADILKCTTRAVQKWLSTLVEEGYIKIQYDRTGSQTQRKVYISEKFKKSLGDEPPFTPPRTTVHPPMNHGSPIIEEYYNRDIKKGEEASPPPPLFFKFIKE